MNPVQWQLYYTQNSFCMPLLLFLQKITNAKMFKSSKKFASAVCHLPKCELNTIREAGIERCMSISTAHKRQDRYYKLLVLGGGSGGCCVSAKFARNMDPGTIGVIDPAETHYYQPMWTLVGGGLKTLNDSGRPMASVINSKINLIKDSVVEIEASKNRVKTKNNEFIRYDYLVIALGMQLKYNEIKGLPDAFHTPGVCSNYSPLYVNKTYEALQNFKGGNAIFTFPNSPVKCAGAPQKILYIAEDYFRRHGKRESANIIYNTSLGVLFGVKHYADALWDIVKSRNINVNLRMNLIEVNSREKKAVFQNLDKLDEFRVMEYEMLHVTPPMRPQDVLKSNTELTDATGFLNVNKASLQHVKYENIFGIGDCTNAPTAKTAAAVAAQSGVLHNNLWDVMNNRDPKNVYDGYTSCPLVTSNKTCVLAEFDYTGQPLETFPFNQAKERRTMFHLKKDIMPEIYWRIMLPGLWNGPGQLRKLMHLGFR